MISYLDTNVMVWLAQGDLTRISGPARAQIEESELLISPMVLIETAVSLRSRPDTIPARDLRSKLASELGLAVCERDFPSIADAALYEQWTPDPFDRIIVAHAKANGMAPLVSADQEIRNHYPRAVW